MKFVSWWVSGASDSDSSRGERTLQAEKNSARHAQVKQSSKAKNDGEDSIKQDEHLTAESPFCTIPQATTDQQTTHEALAFGYFGSGACVLGRGEGRVREGERKPLLDILTRGGIFHELEKPDDSEYAKWTKEEEARGESSRRSSFGDVNRNHWIRGNRSIFWSLLTRYMG